MAFLFENLNKYRLLTFLVNLSITPGTLRPYVLLKLASMGEGDIASLPSFWGVGPSEPWPGAFPVSWQTRGKATDCEAGAGGRKTPGRQAQHAAARLIRCIM